MRPLFLRVLVLLFGSFTLIAVVSALMFRWVSHELDPHEAQLQEMSRHLAQEIAVKLEKGDFDSFRSTLRNRFNVKTWVRDEQGTNLTRRALPDEIASQITGYPSIISPHENTDGRYFIFAHQVSGESRTYDVVMTSYRPRFGHRNPFWIFWLLVLALVIAMICASGLLSYWILRPVRTIGSTSRELAMGNLQARTPQKLITRKDAFGDLAREFNVMADKVQNTIENQNQLLRDVSHELRSPMARILVAASLLGKKSDSLPEIERIENEIQKMNGLVEDLISLSRLRNQVDLEKKPVDLVELISSISKDADFEFQQSGKSVNLMGISPVPVNGNAELLGSMLENVIRNGLRYSPDNSALEILATSDNRTASVSIIDSGPGVKPEEIDRIFDAFYRSDQSRQPSENHHGIGLTLAKAIVELHGGNISASNIASGGLEVRIELPSASSQVSG